MFARDEADRFGVTHREPDCHRCPHRWHLLECVDGCPCLDHTTPGIY